MPSNVGDAVTLLTNHNLLSETARHLSVLSQTNNNSEFMCDLEKLSSISNFISMQTRMLLVQTHLERNLDLDSKYRTEKTTFSMHAHQWNKVGSIEAKESSQECPFYPEPIPVRLVADGISVCYQAPPLPSQGEAVDENNGTSTEEYAHISPDMYVTNHTSENSVGNQSNQLLTGLLKPTKVPLDLKWEDVISDEDFAGLDSINYPSGNSNANDNTRSSTSETITNNIMDDNDIDLTSVKNKCKEVILPDNIDLSPQIMQEDDTMIKSESLHCTTENKCLSSSSSCTNTPSQPIYLPLLSSYTCKEENYFEDIYEEGEDTTSDDEEGDEEDDYPSSWDEDADTTMLSSPRVRSQNAWSVVGVEPMTTNSSFDFYQEKDRLKLMRPPKLSKPNVNRHNKYASDSNISDALIMLEPGLRKMAKDECYTTTNSSCNTGSQTDEGGKLSHLGSRVNTSAQGKEAYYTSATEKGPIFYLEDSAAQRSPLDFNNRTKTACANAAQGGEFDSSFVSYSSLDKSKMCSHRVDKNETENTCLDLESGFYSYIAEGCCEKTNVWIEDPTKSSVTVSSPYQTPYHECQHGKDRSLNAIKGKMELPNIVTIENNGYEYTDAEYNDFLLLTKGHVTRIPINQSKEPSILIHQFNEDDSRALNQFSKEYSNVTVNGVCFSTQL